MLGIKLLHVFFLIILHQLIFSMTILTHKQLQEQVTVLDKFRKKNNYS